MKRLKYDTASRRHTFIAVLGITVLAFLVLISNAGAMQLADIPNSGSNGVSDYNKGLENNIKTQDRALQIDPQNSTAWNIKGIDLFDLKRYDEAIMAYEQAIKINPHDAFSWALKGDALYEQNKTDEAEKAWDKKNDILESNRISNRNKALENNIKADDKAIEINPHNSKAWYNKGVVLGHLNRSNEAIKAYGKAIKLNP
jgi:tetratricopeptide (TPR) repeat protein